jgi:serine O-acetyltransferase
MIESNASIPKDAVTQSNWNLTGIVAELGRARLEWREKQGISQEPSRDFPSRRQLSQAIRDLTGALFPSRLGPHDLREEVLDFYVGNTLAGVFAILEKQILLELNLESRGKASARVAQEKVRRFGESLPEVRRLLDADLEFAFNGDPAARSVDEILLCYPGMLATIYHRLAHRLHKLNLPLIARIVAEIAHSLTGVDIHPGASIGSGFFIDHGTGVVIGETAVIGSRVRLYQAVTLGAKSFPKAEDGSLKKGLRRHPIVEDDVVIYAGATVLGRITIGQGSVIGGNVWLTRSVEPGSSITQGGVTRTALLDGDGI